MTVNWKIVAAIGAAVVLFGYQQAQNAALRRELATTVKVIDQKDKETALERGRTERMFELFKETIEATRTPTGSVIIRTTEARTPTGAAPGQPGRPGVMIAGPAVDLARASASERIVTTLRPGSLLNCPTPGLQGEKVELLRDSAGRLLSPTTCVTKIEDTLRLQEPPPAGGARARSRWKAVVGISTLGADYGIAYEALKLWLFSLDGVALVRTQSLGAGLSVGVSDAWTVGPYATYSISGQGTAIWVLLGYRP